MTLALGTRLGPYEVVKLLGAGGMGEVYRARDPRLGRDVAVKVLSQDISGDPDRLRRFEQEARAVAALSDSHIVTVYDVGAHDGTPYVVSELLEGENLREVLSRRKPTQRQVLGWSVQIAQGLAAAHHLGIVHRDLKPENLFLTRDGRVKILDFGLAKLARVPSLDSQDPTAANASQPGLLLGTVPYMSPEQVRALPVDARSDIFSFGVVLYELLTRKHPFRRATVGATLSAILADEPPPLAWVDRTLPPAVDGIVRRCLEKGREDRFQGAHDLALALEAVLQAPTGSPLLQEVEERSPYPGLMPFTEKDAGVFFGREEEVHALWERIHSRRLLAVIGASGVGKTSFLRAGVIPARPEGWSAVHVTPGSNPALGLARALTAELAGDPEAMGELLGGVNELTQTGETGLVLSALKRWRAGYGDALLVVDQFEELFTLNSPETQQRFASLLGRLVADADIHVVLSLRDDFLIRCSDQPPLAPVFCEITPLTALTREGFERALVEPAKKQGYRFDATTLVNEMVSFVEGVRGALPLLAFAVARLWEKRDRTRKLLTREAYQEIAGVEGALAQHAEATMDRIGPDRQDLVRETFRNLVTSHGTRAVAERDELLSAFPERKEAEDVLRELIDARLLTSYEVEGAEGQPSHHRIEIVHESLLKAWPRLVRWQAQDEEGAVLRDQLRQAAHLWEEKGRTKDLLWTGTPYREYLLWRERYPGTLTAVEEAFANAMVDKARRKKRLVRLAAVTAFVTLGAVAVAIGISRQQATSARDQAKAEALRAEASKLLALAQVRLKEDPTEALAFATASLELADTSDARLFAVRALAEAPPAWEVLSNIPLAKTPRFSPDGHRLAVAGHSAEVGVWLDDGGPPLRLPDHETSPRGGIVSDWASDNVLVTGSSGRAGSRVYVWSLPEGRRLRTIDFGAPSRWQVGPGRLFSETPEGTPGPSYFVGGLLRSWQLPDGEPEILGRIDGRKLGITSSFFEPGGRAWLYTKGASTHSTPLPVGLEGDRLFSRHPADVVFRGPSRLDLLAQHETTGENRLLRFREDGHPLTAILAKPGSAPADVFHTSSNRWLRGTPENDAKLRLWDTTALPNSRPLELRRTGSWYSAACDLHPNEQLVVATTHDQSRQTFWPLPARWPNVVEGYKQIARPLAFSPDGRWLATAWDDGRVRLWPLPGSGSSEVKVFGSPQIVLWESLAFDPGGRYLFAVGISDNAWIIPLDGSPARQLQAFSRDTLLQEATVSPTGRHLATAFSYGKGSKTLRVWDVETGAIRLLDLPEPAPPPGGASPAPIGSEAGIFSLSFLDDSTLYTAGHGGVRRWHLDTGAHELVMPLGYTHTASMWMTGDGKQALVLRWLRGGTDCAPLGLLEIATGASRTLAEHGDCVSWAATGPAGLVASGSLDGTIRVARHAGEEPHILAGHTGNVDRLAISPDLRWIASTGEDNTLRLWPMPDLDKPPLHTLPREELLARLHSLTNLRVVRDAATSSGWKVELGPFPGWKDIPLFGAPPPVHPRTSVSHGPRRRQRVESPTTLRPRSGGFRPTARPGSWPLRRSPRESPTCRGAGSRFASWRGPPGCDGRTASLPRLLRPGSRSPRELR